MNPEFIDRYSRLDSPVHKLPVGSKIVAALVLVLGVALWPAVPWQLFGAVGALLLALMLLSQIPPRFLLRRLLIAEPFALSIAALALFQPGGWHIFLVMLTKSTLCLAAMILLTATTPFTDLLAALRRARIPVVFVTTLALLYRYLFVLADESSRMRRARLSRSFAEHRAHQWRALATVAGQLFIRASGRAERIFAAMSARGWEQK
ncbi:MAG: cobalt ECF transporter T component CbiQ [Verrucomicrobia bacterium]|nr:MAG: cobalt ECF transporter T component CbiQ [Verrucomicrobiota bacterium]